MQENTGCSVPHILPPFISGPVVSASMGPCRHHPKAWGHPLACAHTHICARTLKRSPAYTLTLLLAAAGRMPELHCDGRTQSPLRLRSPLSDRIPVFRRMKPSNGGELSASWILAFQSSPTQKALPTTPSPVKPGLKCLFGADMLTAC